MPHGQRDWSNIGADETVHGLDDMAELAARMGSPDTFNREGNVLLLETFEHGGVDWSPAGIGPGNDAVISAEWARYGAYSYKLTTPAVLGKYELLDYTFPFPVLSKFGIEFSCQLNSHFAYIQVDIWMYDGTRYGHYSFFHNLGSKLLRVYDQTAGYVNIASAVPFSTAANVWHTYKLVFDADTREYQRWLLDNNEYSAQGYYGRSIVSATGPYALLRLQFYGAASGTGIVYLDDVIITQNEP